MKRSLFLFLFFTSGAWAAPMVFCELAALPRLPLASDPVVERLSSDELLARLAESYRGLLEFGGDGFSNLSSLAEEPSLEKFFIPGPGRDQRSVAFNESLSKLGDWVLLEAEDQGLTQEMITARLREVVRAYLEQASQERVRADETREERRDTGRETSTGAVFHRDTRFPELGEAYRDPDGMVWGDVVKNPANGSNREMKYDEALEYCKGIGADLPSREDWIRLREYMGAQQGSDRGYKAQILPGLGRERFWSSSVHPRIFNSAYYFNGDDGYVGDVHRDVNFSVRCVRR